MLAEFLRIAMPTPESLTYLKRLGLNERLSEIEAYCTDVSVALVQFFEGSSGRIFRFHLDGEPAVVIAAHPAVGEMPHDLIAWPLYGAYRASFATYLQRADLLGIPAALRAQRYRQPLRLYQTPEDWLCFSFQGSVVLNPKQGGYWLNKLSGPFIADDVGHGHEVAEMLRPYGKAHLVKVPSLALDGLRRVA